MRKRFVRFIKEAIAQAKAAIIILVIVAAGFVSSWLLVFAFIAMVTHR